MQDYEAVLKISRKDFKHVFEAIDKEAKIKERCTAKAVLGKKGLEIRISAKDASSFRAALNTYLRIIQSTENL